MSLRCARFGTRTYGRTGEQVALVTFEGGGRRVGVFTQPRNERLGQGTFYVLMPSIVFVLTYDEDLGALLSLDLVVGLLAVLGLSRVLAWVSNRPGKSGCGAFARSVLSRQLRVLRRPGGRGHARVDGGTERGQGVGEFEVRGDDGSRRARTPVRRRTRRRR